MDILRICLMLDGRESLRLRFTSPEGRIITSLITDALATFDRYIDPEYDQMMSNMNEKVLKEAGGK